MLLTYLNNFQRQKLFNDEEKMLGLSLTMQNYATELKLKCYWVPTRKKRVHKVQLRSLLTISWQLLMPIVT